MPINQREMESHEPNGNERLRAEIDRLNCRIQRKNEYLRFISHDLRNPMTTIVGNTDLILQSLHHNCYDNELFMKYANNILHASRQVSSLITELDNYSAFDKGEVELNLMTHDMNDLLKESFDMYLPIALSKSITFRSNFHKLPAIVIDKVRIQEVMDNLITNALKYTKPGGDVYVSADYNDHWISVKITDTGEGLTNDDMADIFKPFSKLSAKPTKGEASTGLGLYISKRIIDLHGGTISVESTKGAGSQFSFQLPRLS